MKKRPLEIKTHGEKFYDITNDIKNIETLGRWDIHSSLSTHTMRHYVYLRLMTHLQSDVGKFMQHLAPRNLNFITHTAEGEDDSPSHMKSVILQQSLQLIVEDSDLVLGQWQGIYLAEFRDAPHTRKIYYKFIKD